jgi:hypothetical protein
MVTSNCWLLTKFVAKFEEQWYSPCDDNHWSNNEWLGFIRWLSLRDHLSGASSGWFLDEYFWWVPWHHSQSCLLGFIWQIIIRSSSRQNNNV